MKMKFPRGLGMLSVLLAVIALGLSLSFILFYDSSGRSANRQSALPEFSMPVLEGERHPAGLVGNRQLELPALINVWASWCVSCRYEHPLLTDLADRGIRIYGINYQDELADAQKWLQENGDPYVLSIKDRRGLLGAEIGLYGVPETYFVDASETILVRHVGVLTEQVWLEKFLPLWVASEGE